MLYLARARFRLALGQGKEPGARSCYLKPRTTRRPHALKTPDVLNWIVEHEN
jgi:hypothetical protein